MISPRPGTHWRLGAVQTRDGYLWLGTFTGLLRYEAGGMANFGRNALHSYLGSVCKQLDCPPILVGGVEDHGHLLARFGRTITQAEWVKELKRVSNAWLKERGRDFADFEWQGGYAAFFT